MGAPIMLLVIIFPARWMFRQISLPPATKVRLGAGFTALAFLLDAEFTVVLAIRHLTVSEYMASRDPLAGTVYDAVLLVFAVMPLFITRKQGASSDRSLEVFTPGHPQLCEDIFSTKGPLREAVKISPRRRHSRDT